MRYKHMPFIKKSQFIVIVMSLVVLIILPPEAQSESMSQWTINMQDEADNYARWLDHPPKTRNRRGDALVMRKFIYTCTMLKAYSLNDWCSSSSLTKRWLGYASSHGFNIEIRGYKQTTAGNFRFPKNTLREIYK